jgi:hypothetical protein
MYLLTADFIGRERAGGMQEAAAARLPLLHKAIELDPKRRGAYRQLAYDLMFYDTPKAEDLLALELGQRQFKGDDWINVGVAAARMRLGDGNDVLQVIQTALRPDSSLTTDERRTIGTVRRNLLMKAMDAELRTTQDARDFTAARAIIARYRTIAGDDREIADYLQRRDSAFEMSQLVERMNAAMAGNRTAELNQLFDQILAHPAVTPQLRNTVESNRRRLRQ